MTATLEIRNLHASVEGDESLILRGVDLTVKQGEIHALMGPNASGKSTLANVLMGNPAYEVHEGEVLLNGERMLEMEPDERSRAGLFLAFQYPVAIPGVTLANFLRHAINARMKAEDPESKGIPIPKFARLMRDKMTQLHIDHSFAGRYLNEGFSGGEKKRAEVLQMAVLEPQIAVLDETGFRPGYRRAAHRRRRRQLTDGTQHGCAGDYTLSADAESYQAGLRPCVI